MSCGGGEVDKLRKELEEAKEEIARLKEEKQSECEYMKMLFGSDIY